MYLGISGGYDIYGAIPLFESKNNLTIRNGYVNLPFW